MRACVWFSFLHFSSSFQFMFHFLHFEMVTRLDLLASLKVDNLCVGLLVIHHDLSAVKTVDEGNILVTIFVCCHLKSKYSVSYRIKMGFFYTVKKTKPCQHKNRSKFKISIILPSCYIRSAASWCCPVGMWRELDPADWTIDRLIVMISNVAFCLRTRLISNLIALLHLILLGLVWSFCFFYIFFNTLYFFFFKLPTWLRFQAFWCNNVPSTDYMPLFS